jgi:hypothetical protein
MASSPQFGNGHPEALEVADLEVGELADVDTPQVSRLPEVLIGDMSRAELMSTLALKDRMHFTNDYLRPALEEDLIQYTIPDKPNSRLQQYRLTEKRRAVLASLEKLRGSEGPSPSGGTDCPQCVEEMTNVVKDKVAANRELIARFEKKFQVSLARV